MFFEYISSLALKNGFELIYGNGFHKIAVCKYAVAVKSMCGTYGGKYNQTLAVMFSDFTGRSDSILTGQKNIKENNIKMTVSMI